MTEGQVEIVLNICRAWGKRFYYLRDDFPSIALLACLEAEQRNPDHSNPTALFIRKAQGAIKSHLRKELKDKATWDKVKHSHPEAVGSFGPETILDEYAFNQLHLFIVEQRLAGYTLAEIGNQLGRSKQCVSQHMAKIKKVING